VASLEVTADNCRAVRLYQRLGFRRVRTVYKVSDGGVVNECPAAADATTAVGCAPRSTTAEVALS
jgi:ribosomal protein S18 acetylase RimI-like enzyme